MPEKPFKPDRRDVLKGMAAASVAPLVLLPPSTARAAETRQGQLIREENARPGTTDWQLTRVRVGGSPSLRSSHIEGYCSRQSVEAGESIAIMVSTRPAARFDIEIFRMGYYGGRGARLMQKLGPFNGRPQDDPPVGDHRLRQCQWEPATELTIPADWPSGVYLGRLTTIPDDKRTPYWQSYVVFIVRDRRPADVLFQCADNTWAAYNRWPDNYSLYTDPRGAHAVGVQVSFDRPYAMYPQIMDNPLTVGSGSFLLWEYPLVYFLEQHGYDVTYCSNSDMLDADAPHGPMRSRVFISPGHDEYWDVRQYETVRKAIEGGVNVLWLCGNAVFAVSPFSPASDGRANRVLSRAGLFGGLTDEEINRVIRVFTEDWKRAGPDESLLIGARTIVPFNGGGDWVVTKPDHWVFEGTGLERGEHIPGLVGWEFHGAPADIPGLEVLAEGRALAGGTDPAHWTATIYPGPKGNFAFNAATIWWPQGLAEPPGHMLPWSHWTRPHGPDERVQRITHNLLERALS